MYQKTVLDNGLRIITHRMADMQSAAIGVWIKAGGRYELARQKGISHYLEHLLFKGSKRFSCQDIKESIEGVGGSLNGFTSEELTCFLAKLPGRHLALAIDILSDMVLHPLLSQRDIMKERTVILEEIKMYMDLPQSFVYEVLDELLWPQQPLGMSILGSKESVESLSRKDICGYKSRYYAASNIVISAAGALVHDEVVKRVKAVFSSLQKTQPDAFLPARQMQHKPQMRILHKDTEQTHLALGFHSFNREHSLRHALSILHVVLGANMSSRLFNEVREKRGLAYEIGTAVKRFQDTGAFVVHAGIDNLKVNQAIEVILKELKKTRNSLIGINEFKRAKEFYMGQLMLALEDTMDNMLWIGESLATIDKVFTLSDIVGQIRKVSREDVKEAASAIFREDRLNLALIGPMKDKEQSISSQLHI
jgi:predicted Zn-dependent peptidase